MPVVGYPANDQAARRVANRPVAETVALLRERAKSRFTPPVTGPRAPLTEVLVHEGDMRIPLGLPPEPGVSAVRIGLGFITAGRPVGFVPAAGYAGCGWSRPTWTGPGGRAPRSAAAVSTCS
ncbi:hypothetical protein SAMN05661080_05241 [Modestobacter sp. DSM 44400]|nr:hypothetical protein SAMN05661080_05241 [Modestobacter sp. DSM 44400]